MNTYTNAGQPKKGVHRTARNHLFHYTTIVAVILTLVTAGAIATSHRAAIAAENNIAVPYSNALELQYAQPWLDKANLVVTVNTQEQVPLNCSSSMEMLYACKSGYGLP